MWTTDTFWFEVSLVSVLYVIGNIALGHFEEQTHKIKRFLKYILTVFIVVGLSVCLGWFIAILALVLSLLPVIYIHAIALPKKGINCWTMEPKEKYYELRGWNKDKLYSNSEKKIINKK